MRLLRVFVALAFLAAVSQGSLVQELSAAEESGDGIFGGDRHTGDLGASDWNDSDPFGTPYHISQDDFRKGKSAKLDMDFDAKDRKDLSSKGMVEDDPTLDAKAERAKQLEKAMKSLPQVDGLSQQAKSIQTKQVDPWAPAELLQTDETEAEVESLNDSSGVDKDVANTKGQIYAMYGLFGKAPPKRWFKKPKEEGPMKHKKAVSAFDKELHHEETIEKKNPKVVKLNKKIRKQEKYENEKHDDSMEEINSHEHSAYAGIGIVHGDISDGYGQESPWGRESEVTAW